MNQDPNDSTSLPPQSPATAAQPPRRTTLAEASWALAPLPRLCGTWAGIGGVLRTQPEDFEVEEIPAYAPSGSGEFLYLWVEKRGLSAEQLVSHVARDLKIAHQDIGMAGLKDRHAVTRQWLSVPAKCETRLKELTHPQIAVLQTGRHSNKLRPGHLRGNRFRIVIRQTQPAPATAARSIVEHLQIHGVPNYFGEQRFGRDNETLLQGLDLLRGAQHPRDIPRARRKFLLRLALSSVQSALFNRVLGQRLASNSLHRIEEGEVLQVVSSGGPFVVTDVAREQARFEQREVVPAGPMFGPRMKPATAAAGERELALLAEAGLTPAAFERYPDLTSGTRRALLVWPVDLGVRSLGDDSLEATFTLPSGSYATVLLRELMG
ncbi:MAG: tRNA pseudouridine(13) synthase TruD [Planctomycetaceae bacterium]